MSELIDRQAAIEAIDANNGTLYDNPTLVASLHKLLSELPSATDINVATTDSISRAAVVDAIEGVDWYHINKNGEMVHGANDAEHQAWYKAEDIYKAVESVPSAQPVAKDINVSVKDCISRQAAIDALYDWSEHSMTNAEAWHIKQVIGDIKSLPSAQPEQRYTEEELRVFAHGISLSLLSKRSAQHWRYDKDTATEIEFLERLYEKVGADMRGEQECTKKI